MCRTIDSIETVCAKSPWSKPHHVRFGDCVLGCRRGHLVAGMFQDGRCISSGRSPRSSQRIRVRCSNLQSPLVHFFWELLGKVKACQKHADVSFISCSGCWFPQSHAKAKGQAVAALASSHLMSFVLKVLTIFLSVLCPHPNRQKGCASRETFLNNNHVLSIHP